VGSRFAPAESIAVGRRWREWNRAVPGGRCEVYCPELSSIRPRSRRPCSELATMRRQGLLIAIREPLNSAITVHHAAADTTHASPSEPHARRPAVSQAERRIQFQFTRPQSIVRSALSPLLADGSTVRPCSWTEFHAFARPLPFPQTMHKDNLQFRVSFCISCLNLHV